MAAAATFGAQSSEPVAAVYKSEAAPQSAGFIRDYWRSFWAGLSKKGPNLMRMVSCVRCVRAYRPLSTTKMSSSPPPSTEELLKVAGSMRGAAGPHGWTGPELAHLPVEAWAVFRPLESCGKVPAALHEAHAVSLAKNGNATHGVLEAKHTRPINYCSQRSLGALGFGLASTDGFCSGLTSTSRTTSAREKAFQSSAPLHGILENFSEEGYAVD